MEHFNPMSYIWQVLAGGAILWVLGALWYSPLLFAKPWVAIVGRKMGEQPKGVYWGMIASFLGDVFLAFVFLHILRWQHVLHPHAAFTVLEGIHVGLLCWVGFIAAVQYPTTIYEGRPSKYFLINGGYWLIGFVALGALFAVWS
jgi:hypothetical protein